MNRGIIAAVTLLNILISVRADACSLPQPHTAIILTVSGRIQECNSAPKAHFDIAMLEVLPRSVVTTENPWELTATTYEGVLLRDLLDYVKATGIVLKIRALNDYHADLSAADAKNIDVLLAYKRNGVYMPVREKEPLFIVFPFTDDPSLSTEKRFAQSVWQVKEITIE